MGKSFNEAIRELNRAAYEAISACRDTTQHPDVDRQSLRQIAAMTDKLVDDANPATPTRGAA